MQRLPWREMPSIYCPPRSFEYLPSLLHSFMADFTAPSFSLGLDSDQEGESQSLSERATAFPINISSQSTKEDDEDDGHFNAEALDPDPGPRPALKRLRRGPPTPLSRIRKQESPKTLSNADDDEEIELFSSQEVPQKEDVFYTQNRSSCSSSKLSLHGKRVLTTQSADTSKTRKKRSTETASTSASVEASCNKGIFPRLTISPLRKFQLLDSDSDEPSSEFKRESTKKADAFAKDTSFTPQKSIARACNKGGCSSSVPQVVSMLEDFSPMKNRKMETPALDEFCEEFFRSMKYGSARNSMGGEIRASCPNASFDEEVNCFPGRSNWESVKKNRKNSDKFPPAYQYFYHSDARIRNLVRGRLPNFFPIGPVNQEEQLDYMCQFGQTDVSVKASDQAGNKNLEGSSQKRKKNLNNISKEVSRTSGSWMNPRSSIAIPKDAGKRRVRVDVSSAGHWYTAPDGRKVYVSKNGQEFAGRMAYRQYRKESGRRFKKSRKKAAGKKNSVKKNSKK